MKADKSGNRPAVKPAVKNRSDLAHLASFPEFNPNPVIELDFRGNIKYLNPAAMNLFPDLSQRAKSHPFFANWDSTAKKITGEKLPLLVREIRVGKLWYEQAISCVPLHRRFRIYARDITARKEIEASLRKVHSEMEANVRARTGEIIEANKALKIEIGERKKAEIKLQAEREQFFNVLETLPCYMILLSPDYHVVFDNRFFRERFGESHGKRCFEYLFNRTEPCEVCETYKVLKKKKPLEWEWTGPDGRNYYIYDFPFKDMDGKTLIMEVGIDITVQKQALADLRKAHDELELRIQERTGELREVNRLLRAKMVEHRNAREREKRIAEQWQTTFDSITDMVSIQDKDCRLVRVNKAYADAVGMSIEELNGQKCHAVIHQTDSPVENCPHRETLATRKTATREIFEPRLGLYLQVTTSPIFNESGEVTGSVHITKDITERKKSEQSLIRLNRELRAISECNQAIVRARDEIELFSDICRIMCDVVGYSMAWVGAVQHDDAKSVRPIASYGDDSGYLENSNITWADTPLGRGPTGVAARTGKTDFCQDFATDIKAIPWRDAALARGYRSSIAVPLSDFAGNTFAVFMLYADQPGSFTSDEIELLEELAEDISFGVSVLREKAKRLQAETNLRETRDYLDNLFNYANAPIIVWNPLFKVTRFNRAFERLTGHSADEMIGEKIDILFPDDTRDESIKHILKAASGERWEAVEIPIIHKDGTVRILLWNSANLYDADGKTVIATIAQGQDITDRKKAEQIKDEFIGLVSHELRTPLTVITGSLRTAMSRGLSADDLQALIKNATEGADQLASILENMLELSRYQAGHLKLRVEPVSIAGTARSIIKRLKDQGITHEFLIDIPRDLPPVEADPMRVERILYNLLENAVKYSPPGTRITTSAGVDGQFIITRITDQGPGISPEDQDRLFELFQQLETSTRPASGAGLGLVVCKRLVEAQGGWIKVDSALGQGSTFSFALPQSRMP